MPEARLVKYVFTNLTPGEGSDSNDAADANEFNTNELDTSVALAVTRIRGSDCENRASGAAEANFYLRTQSLEHREGAIAAGYRALVVNAAANDYWEDAVQNQAGTGPFLAISDADYKGDSGALPGCTGAYTAEYLNWDIYLFPKQWKFSKGWILFNNVAPGAVTGDDISVGVAVATKIGTYLPALKVRVDAALDGFGALLTDVVTNFSIDKDGAFVTCTPESISEGGDAELFLYGFDLAYGIEPTAPPATGGYAQESTIVHSGYYSQKFTTSASPEGVRINLKSQVRVSDLIAKALSIQAWVYLPVSKATLVGFETNAGLFTTSYTPSAGAWVFVYHTLTSVPAGTTYIYGTVVAGTADAGIVHYVDDWAIYYGNVLWGWNPSEQLAAVHQLYGQDFSKNYIPFSDFSWLGTPAAGTGLPYAAYGNDAWLYGPAVLPVFWNETLTALPVTVARGAGYHFGNASMGLSIPAGEGVYHYIGLRNTAPANECVNECAGQPGTFSVFMRAKVVNPGVITLRLESGNMVDGVVTTADRNYSLSAIGSTTFFWASVSSATIDPAAEWIKCSILNLTGATIEVWVDAVQYTRTAFPLSYRSTTNWRRVEESWHQAAVLATPGAAQWMGYSGLAAGLVASTNPKGPNVVNRAVWYGLAVYSDTVPTVVKGTPVDLFELQGVYWDTVGTAWTAVTLVDVSILGTDTMGAGTTILKASGLTRTAGVAVAPIYHYEKLALQYTPNTTNWISSCSNIIATAHGLLWGP